jgi:hypothetical protein
VPIAFVLLTTSGCLRVNKFNHEPAMAAEQAHDFAHIAFVEHDVSTAYVILSPNTKAKMSLDQFKQLVSNYVAVSITDCIT